VLTGRQMRCCRTTRSHQLAADRRADGARPQPAAARPQFHLRKDVAVDEEPHQNAMMDAAMMRGVLPKIASTAESCRAAQMHDDCRIKAANTSARIRSTPRVGRVHSRRPRSGCRRRDRKSERINAARKVTEPMTGRCTVETFAGPINWRTEARRHTRENES